jgi:hypothetical protein
MMRPQKVPRHPELRRLGRLLVTLATCKLLRQMELKHKR